MDYYMNGAGIASVCIREFETDHGDDISRGTAMTLKNGVAVPATNEDVILGVLASDYYAEKDELIPDSGNGRVRVIITPCAIYKAEPSQTVITQKGTETSVSVTDITMPADENALAGGYVKLIFKKETSANTDRIGAVRRIVSSEANTLTLEEGGVADIGDIYVIVPPAGFCNLALSENAKSLVFTADAGNTAKVVCALSENSFYEIVFTNTFVGK